MLIFDVETGPLAEEHVLAMAKPFEPPPHPGEFDAAAVKCGNLKDAAKIQAKIEEARAAHAASVAGYEQAVEQAREAWAAQAVEMAPLSPVTGRVLAIGYYSAEKDKHAIDHGGEKADEEAIIAGFWAQYRKFRSAQKRLVGANIFGFDLPFLVRRSWILGIEVPQTLRQDFRWWDKCFVDVRELWLLGQRWGDCESSLDLMARALGCGCKPEDCNGAMFWRLWQGTPEERQKAVAYLINDLNMTHGVATRLGIS